MINDQLFDSIKKFSSERQNLLKQIRSSKLLNAKTSTNESIIMEAIFDNLTDLAREVRKNTESIDIAEAVCLGELDTAKKILAEDPSLANYWTPDGFTPLALACAFSGSKPMIELLLDTGAEINVYTTNKFIKVAPIHASMFGGNNDILELLLKRGANPNLDQENKTSYPLHEAVLRKDAKAIKILLKYEVNKTNKTKDGKTAYEKAVESNFKEGIDLLGN